MIIGLLLATPGLAAAQPGSPDLAGLVAQQNPIRTAK